VTGQQHTHVAFFNYGDLKADHPEKMKRVPFNANNPDGPLEICLCGDCNAVLCWTTSKSASAWRCRM
jgi:hypothetical protein